MENKPEPIFLEGVFFDRPSENAPEFVKGKMAIEPAKLAAFIEKHKEHLSPKGWMNFDLKLSQKGSLYFQLNTWKPLEKPTSLSPEDITAIQKARDNEQRTKLTNEELSYPSAEELNAEEIPF